MESSFIQEIKFKNPPTIYTFFFTKFLWKELKDNPYRHPGSTILGIIFTCITFVLDIIFLIPCVITDILNYYGY